MFEVKEKSEKKLISQDRFTRDHEREREFDSIVECQGVDCWG